MTTFPGSPKLLKCGIVLLDPDSGAVRGAIALQYNPETLSRSFQIQAVGSEGGDRSQALRIKGPAVESYKLDVVVNAIDQLEFPGQNPNAVAFGIQPQLALLESLIHPPSARLLANDALSQSGALEILPLEMPLTMLVWSRLRIVPVRVTEFSITEEAFDPALNPIQAKVSLGLRVLSVDDLGFRHKGGSLFMAYLQQKEQLAARSPSAGLSTFGIGGIP
ncbi:MAG: hypothetical protein ACREMX_02180 [Gemmatimonadales bacterium]